MPAYKDAQKGTWYAAFYYQDWKGVKKKKLKRGFPTKKEALAWERTFLLQQAADLTMTFVEIYIVDKQNRLRENTELAETAKQCLIEYANGFQARNPTLRVFWSHLHMDEATPHVHIDFVPYTNESMIKWRQNRLKRPIKSLWR